MSNPPFRLQQLDHVVLRSADPQRLAAFYRRLGCTPVRTLEDAGLLQLRAGSSIIDILDTAGSIARDAGASAPGADGPRNLDHFALRVEPFDADAIERFCADNDIEFQRPHQPLLGADGFGPAVYLQDPDGNRVELKGPPLRPPPDA